jgi:hypothetical protein
MGVETAGEERFVRICFSCLMRSKGSLLGCLEDMDAEVLDWRGVLDCRKCPFVTGDRIAEGLDVLVDEGALAVDLGLELTVTVFVMIFGGAFFAFKAASDNGFFSGGKVPMVPASGVNKLERMISVAKRSCR